VRASDLKGQGAMTLLLKDAINPNLVQNARRRTALIHCGPFGNIAHGCNSVVATKLALPSATWCSPTAGIRGRPRAEKFFDIKCRMRAPNPEAAIVVATVRALKMHGGVKKDALGKADVEAVKRGATNVRRHVKNVKKFGVPVVVALNRVHHGHRGRARGGGGRCPAEGVGVELCEVWKRAGREGWRC